MPTPKPGPLPKFLATSSGKNDPDDEIDDWDQHQDQPPTRSARDFAQDVKIEYRNDRRPAGLTGLGEDLPQPDDHHQRDDEPNDPEHSAHQTAARRSAVIGRVLREEDGSRRK